MAGLAEQISPLPSPPLNGFGGSALFLDLDGTLFDIRPTPGAVVADPPVIALLQRLHELLDGRMAIVSGRSIDDIIRILGDVPWWLAGSHGLEIRGGDGIIHHQLRSSGIERAREALHIFAERDDRLIMEDKPLSVAIHYRLAPERRNEVLSAARMIAADTGLDLQPGKMVIELRPPGLDKGSAIRQFLKEPAMHHARPVFVGDDETDEHGFRAVAENGGFGVLVGPERATRAQYRLADVDAVRDWLGDVAEALA